MLELKYGWFRDTSQQTFPRISHVDLILRSLSTGGHELIIQYHWLAACGGSPIKTRVNMLYCQAEMENQVTSSPVSVGLNSWNT